MSSETSTTWPTHSVETLPWQQQVRGGTREDRMMNSVDAAIPPFMSELGYAPSLEEVVASERALLAVAQASEVLAELDDLDRRIQDAMKAEQ